MKLNTGLLLEQFVIHKLYIQFKAPQGDAPNYRRSLQEPDRDDSAAPVAFSAQNGLICKTQRAQAGFPSNEGVIWEFHPAAASVFPLQRDTRHLAKTKPRKKRRMDPKQELPTTSQRNKQDTATTRECEHNPQEAAETRRRNQTVGDGTQNNSSAANSGAAAAA